MDRPRHLPSFATISQWPRFTPETPLRMIVSGCLAGMPVGVDGTTYGDFPHVRRLMGLANVEVVSFCPEAFSFGVPRATPDCQGGDGDDVLDGRARILASSGEDWTDGMIAGAQAMLARAQAHDAHLAVLMDISAACGSQVIYDGPRPAAPYQAGRGVAAALLARNGIAVVSQRDFRTLDLIRRHLDTDYAGREGLKDHHEIDWYREYFGERASG